MKTNTTIEDAMNAFIDAAAGNKHITKVASSATTEGLERLINEYFYSTTYKIINGQVYNSKGLFDKMYIEYKKGCYTAFIYN